MAPVLKPVSPKRLKALLESKGYIVIDEGQLNWVLARGPDDEPIIIPKDGDAVAIDVMQNASRRVPFPDVQRAIREQLDDEARRPPSEPPSAK